MSKKHFERLADELAIQWDRIAAQGTDHVAGFTMAVHAVMDACQAANPRFDRERFWKAVYEGAKGVRA